MDFLLHITNAQLLTSCPLSQPFTSDILCANIYEMLSPDILHQLIKGTFKDHFVKWVGDYPVGKHSGAGTNIVLDDIDQR